MAKTKTKKAKTKLVEIARSLKKKAKEKLVEICRSFSYKLNVGNFESRDFFMSQKAECLEKDVEKVSEAMHEFCKKMVMRDVNKFLAEIKLGEKVDNSTTVVNISSAKKAPMSSLQGLNKFERKDLKNEVREAEMKEEANFVSDKTYHD